MRSGFWGMVFGFGVEGAWIVRYMYYIGVIYFDPKCCFENRKNWGQVVFKMDRLFSTVIHWEMKFCVI